MSLDVSLISREKIKKTCHHCNSEYEVDEQEVYWANITHNLGEMAEEAGIYKHLWRPGELGITIAKELIVPLESGLKLLKDKPSHFKKFNSENGWGIYENFVPFVEDYLNACKKYPESIIDVYI